MNSLKAFKKLLPTLNRVIIKRFEQETKTASGIILKESSSNLFCGEVMETGPGVFDSHGKHIPMSVKKGDTVLLPDFGGTKVELADTEVYVYRDSDIIGVLKSN